jgi:hypothetical protein
MNIETNDKQDVIFKFSYKEIISLLWNKKLTFPREFLYDVANIFLKTELNFQEKDKKAKSNT